MAAVVLDENADEALERAEHRTVEHHRRHFVRMLVDVKGPEAAGHVEIDLHRAALPIAADGVTQYVFELGPVESPFALVDRPGRPGGLHRLSGAALQSGPHAASPHGLVRR